MWQTNNLRTLLLQLRHHGMHVTTTKDLLQFYKGNRPRRLLITVVANGPKSEKEVEKQWHN